MIYFQVWTVSTVFSNLEQLLANLHRVRIVTQKTKKAKENGKTYSWDIISCVNSLQLIFTKDSCYYFFSCISFDHCPAAIKYGRTKETHRGKRKIIPWNAKLSVDAFRTSGNACAFCEGKGRVFKTYHHNPSWRHRGMPSLHSLLSLSFKSNFAVSKPALNFWTVRSNPVNEIKDQEIILGCYSMLIFPQNNFHGVFWKEWTYKQQSIKPEQLLIYNNLSLSLACTRMLKIKHNLGLPNIGGWPWEYLIYRRYRYLPKHL